MSWPKGKKMSKSHRLKIGKALKGRRLSVDHRLKISRVRKGIKFSNKTKQRISNSCKKSWKRDKTNRVAKCITAAQKGKKSYQSTNKFYQLLRSILKKVGFIDQFPINEFVVDFAHIEGKVVVECDGPDHRHYKAIAEDSKRDRRLKRLGWRVIHVHHGRPAHNYLRYRKGRN